MSDDHLSILIIGTILVLLVIRAGIAIMHRRQARQRQPESLGDLGGDRPMLSDLHVDIVVDKRAKGALPPNAAAHVTHGPVEDHPEDHEEHDCETWADLIGERVELNYVDNSGAESRRMVTVRKVMRRSEFYYLCGMCDLRHAWRMFRADRVRELVRVSTTGEIVEDVRTWIAEMHDPNPIRALVDSERNGLIVLLYAAQCDHRFLHDEVLLIAEYLWDCSGYDKRISAEQIAARIGSMWPNEREFRTAMQSLKKSDADRRKRLDSYLRKVVDVDQLLVPEEVGMALKFKHGT